MHNMHCDEAGPLILLCGPSGVGKSSIARELAATRPLELLSQDDFFKGGFVPYAEALGSGAAEMEDPAHIDWVALGGAVRAARQGGCTCLVEGHTLLSDTALVDESSSILFLDASPAVCAKRRIGRRERSEQESTEISAYYLRFVWPAHLRHVCACALSPWPRPTQPPSKLRCPGVRQPCMLALLDSCSACMPSPGFSHAHSFTWVLSLTGLPRGGRRPVMERLRDAGRAAVLDATAPHEQARACGVQLGHASSGHVPFPDAGAHSMLALPGVRACARAATCLCLCLCRLFGGGPGAHTGGCSGA